MNVDFYNFDVRAAVASYRYCRKEQLDFSPLTLMLFRYRQLTRAEISWLNCARWIKVAGHRLRDSDEQKLEQLHNRILGKPDGGGSPPEGAQEATKASRDNSEDGRLDESGPSIGGPIHRKSMDDEEEKTKPSPTLLVQEPAPVPPVPTAEPEEETTKPAGRLTRWLPRKGSGPEID